MCLPCTELCCDRPHVVFQVSFWNTESLAVLHFLYMSFVPVHRELGYKNRSACSHSFPGKLQRCVVGKHVSFVVAPISAVSYNQAFSQGLHNTLVSVCASLEQPLCLVLQLQVVCSTWETLQGWPCSPPCPPTTPRRGLLDRLLLGMALHL